MAALNEALSQLNAPPGSPLAGYYATTDPAIADTENRLFTNPLQRKPPRFSRLLFERGIPVPPTPPAAIALIGGHLHYYRYQSGGQWTDWEPHETLARWERIPHVLPLSGNGGPAWFALRDANAEGLVTSESAALTPHANFGIRLTVHTTSSGPHSVIACCEGLVDGTIAAVHNDSYTDLLYTVLARKLPRVTEDRLRRALNSPIGPLIDAPGIRVGDGYFTPADERCILGDVTLRKDSTSRRPELSGELFTVRPAVASDILNRPSAGTRRSAPYVPSDERA